MLIKKYKDQFPVFKRLQGKNRSFNKRSYSKIRNITIIPPKNLEFGGLTLLLLPIGGIYKEIPDIKAFSDKAKKVLAVFLIKMFN